MELGDRMKMYECQEIDRILMPGLPAIVRLDGRAFHTFTKGLEKPYDFSLIELMSEVTKSLVEETNALVGYTQSDEISLVLWNEDPKVQPYFGGRIQKITSILASKATAEFNARLAKHLPQKMNFLPLFDARVFSVPTLEEAANCILWREQDATKNSISMAAQAYFSHKSLHGLHSNELQEKLFSEAGVNWNHYPASAKRGSYFVKRQVERSFTTKEIEALPAQHAARSNPNLKVVRSDILRVEFPPLSSIENRVGVLFFGEQPVIRTK